ncbi:MAG TPA: hypothetical protein VF647_02770 [Longimicrobium sp.]|jgi:hypothetical protein
MSRPGPPRDVRLLAACSHLGLHAWLALGRLMEWGAEIYDTPGAQSVYEWSTAMRVSLAVVSFFGPPAAALWAARTSRWRGFLASHGFRALAANSAGGLAMMIMAGQRWDEMIPEIIVVAFGSLLVSATVAWLVLPVGAAFRAKDGELAWYPFVNRLLPDPPEQGRRTPLLPGSP